MNPSSRSLQRTALSVNVNKVALLRNTRHLGIPSVTRAAELCLQAGAHGITVHPRPDERHIRAADVRELAALMKQWPGREYNIEGNPSERRKVYRGGGSKAVGVQVMKNHLPKPHRGFRVFRKPSEPKIWIQMSAGGLPQKVF